MFFLFISFIAAVRALTFPRDTPSNVWAGKDFDSLVTFGDSYTDEQRLNYFGSNNGAAPPPGWIEKVVSPLFPLPFSSVGSLFENILTQTPQSQSW